MMDLFKKLGILLLSSGLAVAALEGGFRLVGLDISISEQARFHPTLGWTINPETPVADMVNSEGFRYPPISRRKPEQVKRLLILGDSFAEARGIPWESSFAGRLQSVLNGNPSERRATWEVINLSVTGWGNMQELIALREYGLELDPDVVVLQLFPFNDLCNNSRELRGVSSVQDYHRPYLSNDWSFRLRARFRLFGWIENQILWWKIKPRDTQAIARLLAQRSERLGLPSIGALCSLLPLESQPAPVRRAWRETRKILTEFVETVRSRDIPLIAVVIPAIRTHPPYWTDFSRNQPVELEPGLDCSGFEEILGSLPVDLIPCKRFASAPLPMTRLFMMPYDPHLNRFGHASVAGWIVDAMRNLGLLDLRLDQSFPGECDLFESACYQVALNGIREDWLRTESKGKELPIPTQLEVLGPEASIAYVGSRRQQSSLTLVMSSHLPENSVEVMINGQPAAALSFGSTSEPIRKLVDYETVPGKNEILFRFEKWKDSETVVHPIRGAPAGALKELRIEPQESSKVLESESASSAGGAQREAKKGGE